jgi:hypothetical protein
VCENGGDLAADLGDKAHAPGKEHLQRDAPLEQGIVCSIDIAESTSSQRSTAIECIDEALPRR